MINNPALGNTLQSLNGPKFLDSVLDIFIAGAIAVGILVFFFMFVSGGIAWISAGDNKGNLEAAKQKITKAITGILILLSVFAVINFIGCVLDVNLLQISIGELNIGFTGSAICAN